MKARFQPQFALSTLLLGLVAAVTGCTNAPTRQSTLESSYASASTIADNTNPSHPVPLRTVAPLYPFDMKRAGNPGQVIVSCLVDAKGRVTDTEVESATDTAFIRPALDALAQWTFKPAMRD